MARKENELNNIHLGTNNQENNLWRRGLPVNSVVKEKEHFSLHHCFSRYRYFREIFPTSTTENSIGVAAGNTGSSVLGGRPGSFCPRLFFHL